MPNPGGEADIAFVGNSGTNLGRRGATVAIFYRRQRRHRRHLRQYRQWRKNILWPSYRGVRRRRPFNGIQLRQ